ncbi:MAG: peptidoglycan DD-metalloendopeptidase family protein [Geminicoccaceae bacterium]
MLHAEDGHPNLEVSETDREQMAGNHLLVACGDAVVVMAHLQRDGPTVIEGKCILTGDRVGGVGNSGNTSEPHLHLHA